MGGGRLPRPAPGVRVDGRNTLEGAKQGEGREKRLVVSRQPPFSSIFE